MIDDLGRIVVAGASNNGENEDFLVARFTPDGALDPTFNGSGYITFAFGIYGDIAHSLAIDSQNRIVVAGGCNTGLAVGNFAVARLTPAGILDSTFNSDGKTLIELSQLDTAYGVAVDSQDRIVVVGDIVNGGSFDFGAARLTPAGVLDATFDGDGKQTISIGATSDFARDVAIDSQDRVVIAGSATNANEDFALVRLTAIGALDSQFNGNGKLAFAFGAGNDTANAVAIDSLDRVVAVGSTRNGSHDDFAIAHPATGGAG